MFVSSHGNDKIISTMPKSKKHVGKSKNYDRWQTHSPPFVTCWCVLRNWPTVNNFYAHPANYNCQPPVETSRRLLCWTLDCPLTSLSLSPFVLVPRLSHLDPEPRTPGGLACLLVSLSLCLISSSIYNFVIIHSFIINLFMILIC